MTRKIKIATFAVHRGVEQLVACYFDLVEVARSSRATATKNKRKKLWDYKKNAYICRIKRIEIMKKLTLQIDREYFQKILKGEHKIEHRDVYPSNVTRYVYFECEGKTYKKQSDIPDGDSEIRVIPIEYDALYLINGRRKDAPRMLVEVESAEFIICQDKDGNDMTYERDGQEYLVCQVWYHLGEVLNTENVKL